MTDLSLRYVEAEHLDNRILDLDDLDVTNAAGDRLGDVDGFLVDTATGRPRYVVVDSGGWFSSHDFVVPIAETRYDPARRALRVDFDRDAVKRFPAVDVDAYDRRSAADWQQYDAEVERACARTTGDTMRTPAELAAAAGPVWWHTEAWHARAAEPVLDRVPDDERRPEHDAREREADRDVQYGERAQPGDVIGIESGGERTHVGDTARDEDQRRERAEAEMRSLERDRPHDRDRERER
jgi:hypothetical protein